MVRLSFEDRNPELPGYLMAEILEFPRNSQAGIRKFPVICGQETRSFSVIERQES